MLSFCVVYVNVLWKPLQKIPVFVHIWLCDEQKCCFHIPYFSITSLYTKQKAPWTINFEFSQISFSYITYYDKVAKRHRNKQICSAHIPKRGKINIINLNFPLRTSNETSAVKNTSGAATSYCPTIVFKGKLSETAYGKFPRRRFSCSRTDPTDQGNFIFS